MRVEDEKEEEEEEENLWSPEGIIMESSAFSSIPRYDLNRANIPWQFHPIALK